MGDPRGFLKYERKDPVRREVTERMHDWKDLYKPVPVEELKTQAHRCMDCGVPFCNGSTGCPVENLIPDWNDLVSKDRWKEALRSLHLTNNFPEFTGKLCPAPCEGACVLGLSDQAVTIRSIESSIIERGFHEGWVAPQIAEQKTGKKVAIVGSGPSGLAAAQQLVRWGHEVTLYERNDRIGGLLRYGIPDFKLEKSILDRRLNQMVEEGVLFKSGVEVGKDITLTDLKSQYDAVILTIGSERPRDLVIPGRNLPGIHFAMDYLVQQNRQNSGRSISEGRITAKGKRVVIIGGGDTGSDCLGTAHRQGCIEAHQFELMEKPPEFRDASTPWPLWPMKLRTSHAHEEGGARAFGVSTVEFKGDSDGVKSLKAIRLHDKSEFEMPVDLVLLAMGFVGPKPSVLDPNGKLALTPKGTIAVNQQFQTNIPKIFASGDAVRGQSLIVWAIADGRKMAQAVNQYLMENRD